MTTYIGKGEEQCEHCGRFFENRAAVKIHQGSCTAKIRKVTQVEILDFTGVID